MTAPERLDAKPADPPKSSGRMLLGLGRGVHLRCPNCGAGRLYQRYLSLRSPCEACGHDNSVYPSDDAAPYFTILLVGHLVVAPFLFLSFVHTAPIWLVLGTTIPVILTVTLVALPFIKGAVIGGMWAMDFTRQGARFELAAEPPPPAGEPDPFQP